MFSKGLIMDGIEFFICNHNFCCGIIHRWMHAEILDVYTTI